VFPVHCNEVGVRKVNFDLTEKEIRKVSIGKQVYWKSHYLLLSNHGEWAVVKIRTEGSGLFRDIAQIDVIALPNDIEYVKNSSLNVLSISTMAQVASKTTKLAVIVEGAFDHMSFISGETTIVLNVYDVVPPKPSKLLDLTEKALARESIDRPIILIPKILDVYTLISPTDKIVMFPCHTSGVNLRQNNQSILFLDESPTLTSTEAKSVTLIGCDLSRKVFRTQYGVLPKSRNMCPKKWALKEGSDELSICLCCLVDCDFKREDNLLVLPWGVTSRQVEAAIKSLWE
jgi:hypothetical protein